MNIESLTQDSKPARYTEQQIRERAYLLWEMEGRPLGRSDEYWHRAQELLEDEDQSAYPPTQARGHRS